MATGSYRPWKVLMNFLFQVVYNEFLPSCYVRYSTSFSLFVYLFLELKNEKYYNVLSHDSFLFTSDRECPPQNCLFQARWLEDERFKHETRKKMTLLQYAIITLKMSVLALWRNLFQYHA